MRPPCQTNCTICFLMKFRCSEKSSLSVPLPLKLKTKWNGSWVCYSFCHIGSQESCKLWPEAPGGTIKPFLRNVLGNSSTTAFICNHLMLFQLHIILAGVDTLWIVCGVFASNSESQKYGTLQLVEGCRMNQNLPLSLSTKFCQILLVFQNMTKWL